MLYMFFLYVSLYVYTYIDTISCICFFIFKLQVSDKDAVLYVSLYVLYSSNGTCHLVVITGAWNLSPGSI